MLTKLLSEINSMKELQTSLSRVINLKDSDAGYQLLLSEQKKLKARLEVFKREMAQDIKNDYNVSRQCQSIEMAVNKIGSAQVLFRARPSGPKNSLAYAGHNDEASAKESAKVMPEEKPKKKRLLVSEELKTSHLLLAKELRSKRQRREEYNIMYTYTTPIGLKTGPTSVFVLAMVLMAVVAASLFAWHRNPFSSGVTPTEMYCESFDRLGCENGGYPVETEHGFVCKCVDDYYGERCAHETFSSAVFRYMGGLFDSTNTDLRRGMPRMWWSFLPFTSNLRQTTIVSFYLEQMQRMKNGLSSGGDGDVDRNVATTRILPPGRPLYCPVNNALPPLDTVYDTMFRRKPDDKLKRDPKRRNMLYHTFYQYFVLQFFDARFNSTVTGSQLYGADESVRRELRSFAGGKLRTEQYPNDEDYPPRLSLAEKFSMMFSRMWSYRPTSLFDRVAADAKGPQDHRWAMGHPLLSMNPALFAMHTLWVREHNRVCDQLAAQRPEWTDDRLHEAAKRIVVGEMMGIMMNDVVLNAGGDPRPPRHDPAVHQGRVPVVDDIATPTEMMLTMMMPSGAPEGFGGDVNKADPMLFGDNSQVLKGGMGDAVRFMVDQPMGMMCSNNDGAATEPLTKALMKTSREHAVQSFNRYRAHLGLRAYGSFYELTGSRETADKLQSLYGNVDNVEMLTGMLAEKSSDDSVPTFTVMMNSFVVNSIVSNPLYSKTMWKPDTFDGDYGFSIVKSASIRTFICNNLHDECDNDEFIVRFYTK